MSLTIATSLTRHSAMAKRTGRPLVVMTSLPGCPYCDLVRDHYLSPMALANEVVAVQLNITDNTAMVEDFDGQARSAKTIAKRWDARFAHLVIFQQRRR